MGFLNKLLRSFARRLGSRSHAQYWQKRQIDWKAAYLDTWNHPHRMRIVEKLRKIRFGSILEIGCASGPNLFLIQNYFTDIKIGGIDINKDAIATARQWLAKEAILEVMKADDPYFGDGSTDVVLTDMLLIYGNAKRIVKELHRIARNDIILVEFHSTSLLERLLILFTTGYHVYNYKRLLAKTGFYDIEMQKLTSVDWPGGGLQEKIGYLIHAKR